MIDELINRIVETDELYSIVGKVTSIDESKRTCVVAPLSGDADISGVWLQSVVQGDTGVFVVPIVESIVIVTMLSRNAAFVAKTHEIDRIELDVKSGLRLTVGNESFATSMKDLVEESKSLVSTLKNLILLTSSGPTTGVSPTSLAVLQEHEIKLSNIGDSFKKMLVE